MEERSERIDVMDDDVFGERNRFISRESFAARGMERWGSVSYPNSRRRSSEKSGLFGEVIMQIRRKNGLSQAEFGEKLNVSRQTVSKWETDEVQPSSDNMKMLCEVFGISKDAFFPLKDVEVDKPQTSLNEIAATSTSDSTETDKRNKFLLPVIILGVMLSVMLTITLVYLELYLRQRYYDVVSNNVGDIKAILGILLAILFAVTALEILFIILYIKKKQK